jgi:hypothetical protein
MRVVHGESEDKRRKIRNRKRYWNDVHALQKQFGITSKDARQLWRKTVDELGEGKRSKLSRENFTGKAKKVRKKSHKGEVYHGSMAFQNIDGPMTVAMRKGYEMRFEFGPWWTSNVTTPKDESEALELRRQMRDVGDEFYAIWGDVKASSDSWRIQDFVKVFVNDDQRYFRFEWNREAKPKA